MVYPRMDQIFMILYENSVVKFWPFYNFKELKGGQRGEGGSFLHMGRTIGNLLKPIWVFLKSQYYDL